MEQKNNRKHKFNIVDLLVLVVLVAGIAFVGMRVMGSDVLKEETAPAHTYELTYTDYAVLEEVAAQLREGATVANEKGTQVYGTVVSVEVGQSRVYGTDANGNTVASEKEGYCSVTVTVRVQAGDTGYGIKIGDDLLGAGHSAVIRVGNVKLYPTLTGITQVTDGQD